MSADRPDEKFALAVVGKVLDVLVEEYDVNGRQADVDALLRYPDGRIAALEVSSLGPVEEARIMNVLDKQGHKRTIAGLSQCWMTWVPRDFSPRKFHLLDQTLLHCEDRGYTDLKNAVETSTTAAELFDLGVGGVATKEPVTGVPIVWVITAPIGGFTGTGGLDLPDLVNAALLDEKLQGKIEKLAASGHEERHLFLSVRPQAFSFAAYDNLCFGGPLPTEAPQLPEELSQLWLVSGFKEGGVVRAIANHEWRRDHPFD
ncbi:hypothetical protein SK854_45890 [Lentzea sp. BCCO 10_0061]|uniref:Uncharacterized protein n=1 Tax=Lentzea sokolovensis TaxID=3095429 RepID=A0ABU4VF21_9PSEU|nr:hypothetical protein [Lentzea sp. BCCO 10_0061]MDX8149523.1 hypothetical protein [Lentzea sp. BCCO 10_0061]